MFVVDSLKNEIKTGKNDSFPENLESKMQTRIHDQPSGLSKDVYCTDATKPMQKLPTDADIIVAYATTPGKMLLQFLVYDFIFSELTLLYKTRQN